jgi:hypothetical protein
VRVEGLEEKKGLLGRAKLTNPPASWQLARLLHVTFSAQE